MIDRACWREALTSRFSACPVWPEPEILDGWRDLVCDLVDALDATGVRYKIDQIKQKWGALRVYVDHQHDHPRLTEFRVLIREAEILSATVCEFCGKPGEWKKGNTLCTPCFEKRPQRPSPLA